MKLIIEDDEGRKTVVPFARDEISIGRQEGNTIRLTERNVSRRHARLLKQSDAIYIEDLGSYNGVLVNGERIDSRWSIRDGDLIEIGDYDLAVEGAPARRADDTIPGVAIAELPGHDTERTITPTTVTPSVPSTPTGSGRKPLDPVEAPRLVGLAGAFSGQDIRVPKAVTLIGRTDDGNDIALDHPSLSRRHARLQLENGLWRIYDLNSANGLEVNGHRQSVAIVQPGDVLEIGHVRFRFTGPHEVFHPGDEPTIPASARTTDILPAARRPGGRKLLIAAGAGGLVLVGLTAALIVSRVRGKGAEAGNEDLCSKGENLANQRNWSEAIKTLSVAQQLGQACSYQLDVALRNARQNQGVEQSLEEARKLATAGKFHQAVAMLAGVPQDSVYASEAKLRVVDTTAQGVRQLSDNARMLLDNGSLDDAQSTIDDLKQLDPNAASIPMLVQQLAAHRKESAHATSAVSHPSATVAALSTGTVPAAPSEAPQAAPPPPESPAPAPPRQPPNDHDTIATTDITDGVNLIRNGDLAGGVAKLQQAIAEKPSTELVARAHRNIGVAYWHASRYDDALPHLKIFVKLAPNSREHDTVQGIIDAYEKSKSATP